MLDSTYTSTTTIIEFTIRSTVEVDGLAVEDLVYEIPGASNGRRSDLIGPFPVSIYGNTLRIDTDRGQGHVSAYTL